MKGTDISDRYFPYSKQLRKIDETSGTYFEEIEKFSKTVIADDSLSLLEKERLLQGVYQPAAYKFSKEKNYDIAVYCYTQVIKYSTKTHILPLYEIYFSRGNQYRLSKKYPEAIADYTKAIELRNEANTWIREKGNRPVILEEYGVAYNNRGVVYDLLEEYDKALQDFNKVLEIDPYIVEKDQIIANKARVYTRQGKYTEALGEYGKALRISPKNPSFHRNIAVVYTKNKQYGEAISSLEKVLEYDPENRDGYRDEVEKKLSELRDNNTGYIVADSVPIDKGYIPVDAARLFDISYLERFVKANDSSVYPLFIEDGFYYVNNKTKELVIPRRFNEAYPFLNNSALVRYNGKYAIIDQKGNYIIEPTYCTPEFRMLYNPYITPFGDSSYHFISEVKLPLRFYDTMAHGHPAGRYNIIYAKKIGDKYGIFSDDNPDEMIIKPMYDSIYYCDREKNIIIAGLNNKIGITDLQQNITEAFVNDSIIMKFDGFNLSVYGLFRSGEWYYYSADQRDIPLCKSMNKITLFTDRQTFNPEVIGLYKTGNQYNVLFRNGKSLPNNYDWLHVDGVVGVRNNTVYLILDNGEEIPYCPSAGFLKTFVPSPETD